MLACLHDLRDADDLALRQAAAQALGRFIDAARDLDEKAAGEAAAAISEPPHGLASSHVAKSASATAAAQGKKKRKASAAMADEGAPSALQAGGLPLAAAVAPVAEDPEDSPLRLLGRMFYSQLKSQLGSASLAVRQEHLTLMRALAVQLPRRFPDLALLASPDVRVWGKIDQGCCPMWLSLQELHQTLYSPCLGHFLSSGNTHP